MTIARLSAISVQLGGRVILHDLDWVIPEHPGLVVVRGPSGSGKTTLLHLLSGVVRPSAGELEVLGADLVRTSEPERRRLRANAIAHVYQDFRLVPELTALENVALPLWLRGIGQEARERARTALDAVGLAALADRHPGAMSGGEQQRVAMARVIAAEPRLILADEPTANLDDAAARQVEELLRAQVAFGRAVVVATHDRRLYGAGDLILDLHQTVV
jgi:putative ABC transport system ATP-binding protein